MGLTTIVGQRLVLAGNCSGVIRTRWHGLWSTRTGGITGVEVVEKMYRNMTVERLVGYNWNMDCAVGTMTIMRNG